MRFLFLDIDGVLNARRDFMRADYTYIKNAPHLRTKSGERYNGISQPRVARLAHIIEKTGAKVVLVSSWKPYYMQYMRGEDDDHIGKYLVNALSRKNVHIFDTTERFELSSWDRGGGIIRWLRNWRERFPNESLDGIVILDDDSFDYHKVDLDRWWVETDYYGETKDTAGLNDDIAAKAIDILLYGGIPDEFKDDVAKCEASYYHIPDDERSSE